METLGSFGSGVPCRSTRQNHSPWTRSMHAPVDEVPAPPGRVQEVPIAADLVGVEEAHDGLGLGPPFLVAVDDPRRGGPRRRGPPSRSTPSSRTVAGDPDGRRPHGLERLRVGDGLGGLAEQPARLDVVAERVAVRSGQPRVVEEVVKMIRRGIEDVREEVGDRASAAASRPRGRARPGTGWCRPPGREDACSSTFVRSCPCR